MRNKKINIKTIIIIVLIGIIISMFFIILNIKNNNIVGQKIRKEQLGETTTDNAYVELQTHLSEVNEKEQKLLSFKTKVASAITDMGITTSEDADSDTMANNIRSILGASSADKISVATKYDFVVDIQGTYTATKNETVAIIYSGFDDRNQQTFTLSTTGNIISHERKYAGKFEYAGNDFYIISLKENDTITYNGHNSIAANTFIILTV